MTGNPASQKEKFSNATLLPHMRLWLCDCTAAVNRLHACHSCWLFYRFNWSWLTTPRRLACSTTGSLSTCSTGTSVATSPSSVPAATRPSRERPSCVARGCQRPWTACVCLAPADRCLQTFTHICCSRPRIHHFHVE